MNSKTQKGTNQFEKKPKSRHDKPNGINCAQIISKLMHFVRSNAEILMIFNQSLSDLFTRKEIIRLLVRSMLPMDVCVCVCFVFSSDD